LIDREQVAPWREATGLGERHQPEPVHLDRRYELSQPRWPVALRVLSQTQIFVPVEYERATWR
jgi:hypothetical protein